MNVCYTFHFTETITKVNNQIEENSHGRLFAVIHFAGKQRRVTDGDLIMVEGTHPTNVGDVIRAEKVLLLGSRDFTLLGRPLLRPDLVRVEATVVEKSLTHTKTIFRNRRRKNYMRINCNYFVKLIIQAGIRIYIYLIYLHSLQESLLHLEN